MQHLGNAHKTAKVPPRPVPPVLFSRNCSGAWRNPCFSSPFRIRDGHRVCVASQPQVRAMRRPKLIHKKKPNSPHILEVWDHHPTPSQSNRLHHHQPHHAPTTYAWQNHPQSQHVLQAAPLEWRTNLTRSKGGTRRSVQNQDESQSTVEAW